MVPPIAGCYPDDILATRLSDSETPACLEDLLEAIASASSVLCPPLAAPRGPVTCVGPDQAERLAEIVGGAAAGTAILLLDGTYRMTGDEAARSLVFRTPGVTLRSASGRADQVILDGEYVTREMIRIMASDVTIADITLEHALDHAIHVTPSASTNLVDTRLYGLVVLDTGDRLVKVDGTQGPPDTFADNGSLACSTLELTSAGRGHIQSVETACNTGGLVASQTRGWSVHDNTFRGIYCETGGVAQHAIHFSAGSRDTLVERNVVVDCARGVGFGLEAAPSTRRYDDDPYPGITPIGHYDGVIRNNVIVANVSQFDTGIELAQARGTKVFHNSIFHPTTAFSSLDYRFPSTLVELRNNLFVRSTQRDQGQALQASNLEGATRDLFLDPDAGDLHLVAGATAAIDQGTLVSGAGNDIDGFPHDVGPPDIGADEFGAP